VAGALPRVVHLCPIGEGDLHTRLRISWVVLRLGSVGCRKKHGEGLPDDDQNQLGAHAWMLPRSRAYHHQVIGTVVAQLGVVGSHSRGEHARVIEAKPSRSWGSNSMAGVQEVSAAPLQTIPLA
jgi:hypothetical protein